MDLVVWYRVDFLSDAITGQQRRHDPGIDRAGYDISISDFPDFGGKADPQAS